MEIWYPDVEHTAPHHTGYEEKAGRGRLRVFPLLCWFPECGEHLG